MSVSPQNTEQKNRPIVLCGPSATGKGTLTAKLFQEFGQKLGKKVSTTTRAPRVGETDGVHYYFVSPDQFEQSKLNNEFIETADVHGKFYGTTFASLDAAAEGGKVPLVEFDIKGVCSVQNLDHSAVDEAMNSNDPHKIEQLLQDAQAQGKLLEAIFIWVAPPSQEALEQRLVGRGTETQEQIQKRLVTARFELDFHRSFGSIFDYTVVNDDLEVAYGQLRQILIDNYPSLQSQ